MRWVITFGGNKWFISCPRSDGNLVLHWMDPRDGLVIFHCIASWHLLIPLSQPLARDDKKVWRRKIVKSSASFNCLLRRTSSQISFCHQKPFTERYFSPSCANRRCEGTGEVMRKRKKTLIEVALIGWIIWCFHVHKFPFIKPHFFFSSDPGWRKNCRNNDWSAYKLCL